MDPTNPASHGRLHALDGLRAVMLLLGLVLHTFVSYQVVSAGAAWPYKDALTTPVADYVVAYIHVFRMPIFFVLAGFFAAMLDLKRGALGMLDNRARRILIPGALALLVLFPLTIGGFAFANAAKLGSIQAGWVASGSCTTCCTSTCSRWRWRKWRPGCPRRGAGGPRMLSALCCSGRSCASRCRHC
jgi:peptidoglycan/LPS O-acetylase OafA/YrhL